MLALDYSRQRIRSVLDEINRLQDSDFPYSHSRDALQNVKTVFDERLTALDSLTDKNDKTIVQTTCAESLLQVFRYLPLLGFVLRSTNVRNSFEIFGPLLRLSRQILGPDTRLIISSEWIFSPHVYNPIPHLPNFVLLGLPASESGNPLLVPIAGHELGHTTWHRRSLNNEFGPAVSSEIDKLVATDPDKYKQLFGSDLNDLFKAQNLAPAHYFAMRQVEESFCDFLGVKLFSESYLYAFAYLVTPGIGERSQNYPSMTDRVDNMLKAASVYGVSAQPHYADEFAIEKHPSLNDKEQFLLDLADAARAELVHRLIEKAGSIATAANVPQRSDANIASVAKHFARLTPAFAIGDLTNILNAGWKSYHDEELWQGLPFDRISTLNELVLKSIEILEIEERTK